MELVLVIGSLVLLALAAPRWGHDSRRLLDPVPWLPAPRPKRPTRGLAAAARRHPSAASAAPRYAVAS